MARAPRKPSATKAAATPVIPAVETLAAEPSPLAPPASPAEAAAFIDAAVEAGREAAIAPAAIPAAVVPPATVQATADAIVDAVALPDAVAAPIFDEAAAMAAAIVEPVTAAVAAVSPAPAANAFADGVTALCESGAALAEGFGRLNARLTDVAYGNLREGFALQQAFFGLGRSDALAKHGPAWVGERIGHLASVPGEIAMIALETAEAAARPVVRQARARFAGSAA